MLNNQIVEGFSQRPLFARIKNFYDCLVKERNEGKWDILLLSSDRSFHLFRIFNNEININEDWIYTGTYLHHVNNEGVFKGKKVLLLDNTVSDGCSLFEAYCLLLKAGASKIFPYAYNISADFNNLDVKSRIVEIYESVFEKDDIKAVVTFDTFRRSLRSYRYVSPDDLSEFRSQEIELMQKTCLTLPADIPIMEVAGTKDHMNGEIIMDEAVFHKLCGGGYGWDFVKNTYQKRGAVHNPKFVEGLFDEDIQCGYFNLSNDFTENLKGSFLQSMGVKCKYEQIEDKIHVKFAPFVLMRSLSTKELRDVFKLLMEDTRYGYKLLNNPCKQKDVLMFKAVYYLLSLYAGEVFKRYLNLYDIETEYDMDLLAHYCDNTFLRELRSIQITDICERLKNCTVKNRDLPFPYSDYTMLFQDMTDVFAVVHWQFLQDAHKINFQLEHVEKVVSEKFEFVSCDEFNQTVTSIVLMIMEIGEFNRFLNVGEDSVGWIYKDI